MQESHTAIDFINQVDYTDEFNTYTYRNFYNGAGVGIGDINGDDLPDIYFCGNMAGNRLYLNKGDFVFEDITEKAGVGSGVSWSTGVSLADVNGDGMLDIYVCKSGKPDVENRRNELFINNGDLTFSEKAREYGLDIMGLSNHASFFDFDRDGDLDCYVLNNSFQSVTEFDIRTGQREIRDSLGSNMLLRNDGMKFIDASIEAGIYGSKIGFGLGVSIADINLDGWQDIYVANDFFEKDYLYINSGDGTFRECLEEQIREISLGAMGADIADLNNDAWPEIFVTEMTPEDIPRYRTKAVFDDWDRYQMKVNKGYHHQFPRNTLQLNNRNNSFSEIGRYSGVSATDWSWGALIFDMDNDGWKDIFVANGIYKDLLDRDFLDIYSDPSVMRTLINTEEKAILHLINQIPSVKIPNYAFINNHDLTFTNKSGEMGLETPSWSNGAAFGDLDNDGDLDLVVNNVNMKPFIYRNNLYNKNNKKDNDNDNPSNFLSIRLKGEHNNSNATGAMVRVYAGGIVFSQELIPTRGFQSTSDNRLHFGLGSIERIDSVLVVWPDGYYSVVTAPEINRLMNLSRKDIPAKEYIPAKSNYLPIFRQTEDLKAPFFTHQENRFNDFERNMLLLKMISNEGPDIDVGDINGDGLEDLFICNAKDSPSGLITQDKKGSFISVSDITFQKYSASEDICSALFDAEGDGDLDLYVATGGPEYPSASSALADILYINNGNGKFTRTDERLPSGIYESNSCVKPEDFDNDGDIDLFIGTRLKPFSYGVPATSSLLENDGKGNFKNVTSEKASKLKNVGMVTDMNWADIDNDGDRDMIIIGDWMPVKFLINEQGIFRDITSQTGLRKSEGFWHRIIAKDLNNDGLIDFVLGNEGLNSRFRADSVRPLTMYINDFDMNGTVEQVICVTDGSNEYPLAGKDDMVTQIPSLRKKFLKYNDYKDATMTDIFSSDVLARSLKLYAYRSETSVLLNKGNYRFEMISLPAEAQFSPVYAIAAEDFDHDGICDILVGGNQYRIKPEIGINDASYGLFLKGIGHTEWKALLPAESGMLVRGEIRDFESLKVRNRNILVIAMNNDKIQLYEY